MTSDALSFGQAVGDYELGRPGYPAEAVDWALSRAGAVADVVDVGAGTGKFTASLAGRGVQVTAVEPDPEMRSRLAANLPSVRSLAGTAEALPLADASADLITFAQSWHWVDVPAASAEVARVLRPGGALALIWNIRDPEVEWVERLGEVMGSSKAEQYRSHKPLVALPLTIRDYAEFLWENPMTREQLIAMVTSRSYVITMSAPDREVLLARLDELLDTHPDLAGRIDYRMPYRTRVSIARP